MGVTDEVRTIVVRTAENLGLEIVLLAVDPSRRVRCLIDREPDGVTIDDCTRMSRATIDAFLQHGLDADSFHIEIMSPGVDRPLTRDRDYVTYQGQRVRVTLLKKIDGRKNFSGRLKGLEGDRVVLLLDPEGTTRSFLRPEIKEVRLIPDAT